MAKTHKKKQREEKAKVKLKGAQLQKGLNVTKTEFKVRKIVIRQQQAEEQKFVDGIRIINIKEALNRLKHSSTTNKTEALRNLREAIENRQAEVSMQRAAIVQSVAAMCLEIEQDPRRESFRTLSVLLSTTTNEQEIAPFFHIISSYLRCAMTHITPALQEDSLLMLDVLLKHVPKQVAADSTRILQHFLEMISRTRAEGDKAGRTLLVHMNHKQTAVKWRSKVLQRLEQMLQTLKEHNIRRNLLTNNTILQWRNFKLNQPQHYALKRNFCNGVNTTIFNNNNDSENHQEQETTTLLHYIEHLMPLLLESWLEVRPQVSTMKTQLLLHSDIAETLKIILNIIQCLWALVHQIELQVQNNELSLWFQEKYGNNFYHTFMQTHQFPYETTSKLNKNMNQSCIQQNMQLVQLSCLFNAPQTDFSVIIEYVLKIMTKLNNNHNYNQEELQILAKTLRILLLQHAIPLLSKFKAEMVLLLQATINAHMQYKFEGCTTDVLLLLCEIVESPTLLEAYGVEQQFNEFLKQLPELLLRPVVPERAVLAMTRLSKQKHTIFLEALEPKIKAIVQHIQRIQVQGSNNAFEGRKLIMNLFYWTERNWRNNNNNIQELLKILEENVTDKRVLSYFKYILV